MQNILYLYIPVQISRFFYPYLFSVDFNDGISNWVSGCEMIAE